MRPTSNMLARTIPLAAMLLVLVVAPALARRIDVEVWTDRGDDAVYQAGEAMRVKVRTTEDAYLLVYEIDTDGDVNLLYPWKRGTGHVEGRRTVRLPDEGSDYRLVVEQETGQGFLVAVASDRPFRDLPWFLRPFDPQAASVGYEGAPEGAGDPEEGFDEQGRVVGDPYVAMERIRRRVMERPGDTESFASAYSTYYVHEQVRYPRYLCNDCHRPNRWAWWNGFDPYYAQCSVMDFRVNWSWYWGPQVWTAYVPYYYYVVRTDCPPRYTPWVGGRNRFSSWDGWDRWADLWGGQLRRYKPAPAPVAYTPPPPRGMIWRKGETPPGMVPADVRRQTGTPGNRPQTWLNRDRGDGKPVWRGGPTAPSGGPKGRDGVAPRTGGAGDPDRPWVRGDSRGRLRPNGGDGPAAPAPRDESAPPTPREEPTWRKGGDSPPREAPRREAPRKEPPPSDPGYKQPPPPSSEPPRWTPPASKPDRPDPPKGKGGRGGGKG